MSQSAGWYAILLPCAHLDYCFLDPFLGLAIVYFESHGAFCSVPWALKLAGFRLGLANGKPWQDMGCGRRKELGYFFFKLSILGTPVVAMSGS